ncbi:hypothetical protein VTK26DRAFT_5344 [Humicola hyalothermophila]
MSTAELPLTPRSSIKDTPSFDFCASPEPVSGLAQFSFPFRAHGQRTLDSLSPDHEHVAMVQDIKRRVSDCSSHYALHVSTLIKEYTISAASDDERSLGRRPSATMSERSDSGEPLDFEPTPEAYEAFPEPGFALPGDFLSAHRRSCADFPGQQHGRGDCWCSIAQETSEEENSWLLPNGELSDRARRVLKQPSPANLSLSDSFGNTPVHLFAALDGHTEFLLGVVANSDAGILRAVNTAGQTFLHVLHLEWFSDLANPSARLGQLLAYISGSCPELVYVTDVYGRTFFHRAHSIIRNPASLAGLIAPFNPTPASRRDAFGFNPISSSQPGGEGPYVPPRRTGSLSPQFEGVSQLSPTNRSQSPVDERSFLAYHARLVQVIQSSYNDPLVEDTDGRNGLHCLAEAIINQQTMDRHVQGAQRGAASSCRPHLKRKLDCSKGAATSSSSPPPSAAGAISPASPSFSPAQTAPATRAPAEATLPTRLRHLQSLLHPSVHVDPCHYDRRGMTPLMAFIKHIPDDHDDKSRTLQAILETLVVVRSNGAPAAQAAGVASIPAPNTILEARNRRGETPLLVAARLGRKLALATLLELGANVHARDVDGRGVLEVLDERVGSAQARADVGLYARLEACRVLLTGRREWGVGYVNRGRAVCREWRVRNLNSGG